MKKIWCFSCGRLYYETSRLIIDKTVSERHVCWGCMFPQTKEKWDMENYIQREPNHRWRVSGSIKDGTAKFEVSDGFYVFIDGKRIGPYPSEEKAQERLDDLERSHNERIREEVTEAFKNEGGIKSMDTAKLIEQIDEIAATFTFVRARVSKKVQEVKFEPIEITYEQGMLVRIDEAEDAFKMMTNDLDKMIVDAFMARGINLEAE